MLLIASNKGIVEKSSSFEMGYKEFLFELFDQNLIFQEGTRSKPFRYSETYFMSQVMNGRKPGQP